jgi:D-galactarolactone isomerase
MSRKPVVVAPPGACDTHMHFYDERIPGAPGTFLPGHFPVEDYRAMQKRLGLERVIVVQPNAYADDNAVTLNSIKQIGLRSARGVAVVKPGVSDAELERLTKGGICALRIMTLHGGTLGFDVMSELMARVHPFGWHANLQFDGREIEKHEAQIKRLPGRFVIDHTAKFLEPVTTDSAAFKCLLRIVDTGRCWVKLSAPYETSKSGAPKYEDVSRLARALVKHAPQRMLWASNWPHPSARKPVPPDDADLLDLLLDWAPEESVRREILSDNPAELYRFK